MINPLGERTTYAYDLNGRRTSVQLANGTRTSYVYDLGSRVQMVHTLKSDDSTVSKFEYEYDGNGRRTSVLEADGSRVTWTYDRISQVTSEWRTGTNPHRHTFTYDSVGNRTLKIEDGERTTLVYDACNQLLTSEGTSGTTTFTYDGNGNQTVVQKPNGDRTTQVWDYENRLVKTIQPSGGVTSMAYDADGLRLKLEEPTGTKLFVWDDQNYLAETNAAGATETAFTTEPSTYGSLISHRKDGASTTYHFDALGSTRALTDASETVLERYNYTAFGTLLGSPTLLTPFRWGGMVGYYWDAALATQYIRARHYQPTIARWISLDPIGFAGGDANLFRYVGNSPVMAWDPRGLAKSDDDAKTGIPVEGACKDICGPDVTKWFVNDLKDHYDRLTMQLKALSTPQYVLYWKRNAKYFMSHKWMQFSADGCGTGRCAETVMLGGTCIRKNQLGNIAFGFIVRMVPPYPVKPNPKLNPLDPIEYGYSLGPTYSANHPHAGNWGGFAGLDRGDNLAAFSMGYHLGFPRGFAPIWDLDENGLNGVLRLLYGGDIYDRYTDIYRGRGKGDIGRNTLTFIPEHGGFNTASCKPCVSKAGLPVTHSGQSSENGFNLIEQEYENSGSDLSLDDWLRQNKENYGGPLMPRRDG